MGDRGSITEPAAAPEFSAWTVPELSFRIEYSGEVLEQIRQTAVEGYHRVPRGGVETGGILFGTHIKGAVRITAWRPIACDYTSGPSFLLSENDEAALARALKAYARNPRLTGLQPVGWYRSHNRSQIWLSDSDLTFFNRFFPRPWQIALIVRPASFAPTRAGFFFRHADGSLRTESSYQEFVLTPLLTARPAEFDDPEPEPPSEESPVAAAHAESAPSIQLEPPALEPPRMREGRRAWYIAAALCLAGAALAFWLMLPPRGLSLSVVETQGELHIAWDSSAKSIQDAKSGRLQIDDRGAHTEVKLTPADLRSASVFYARQSGNVAVRLVVDVPGSPPVMEMTRFLAPEPPRQTPTPQARAEPPPPPPTPPASRPSSGRIIWTGRLSKNTRLVIQRHRASTGAVTGTFPSGAARVAAFPAERTAEGITLYTANTRYSRPLTTPPSDYNDRNATTYTWNPERAAEVRVLERPEKQNGYRLVLTSTAPRLSLIVIDWRAAP